MAVSRNNPPVDLAAQVAAFFSARLSQGRRVCVGLSGGCDSVALLHALTVAKAAGLAIELSAVHVHHGLSPNADAWANFCAELCQSLAVPFRCETVQIHDVASEGLEGAARRARYAVFRDCDVDWMALAHHRDDQAETVLLNLLRGAGVHGLAAMPAERALEGSSVRLVRPLLAIARCEIEAWLTSRGQQWIEDESNADTALRRNFLRSEVMPLLASVFPDPAIALQRTATHAAESAVLADEIAVADAVKTMHGKTLLLPAFKALSPARRANLLRFFLRQLGLRMPDARFLDEILRQLIQAAPNVSPVFLIDGATLRVSRGQLSMMSDSLPSDCLEPLVWQGESTLAWANGLVSFTPVAGQGLSRQRLQSEALTLRPRRGGEHLQPDAKRPRRRLKKWLQESDMPLWQRESLPMLCCGEVVLWAAGIGYESSWLAMPDEPGLVLNWVSIAND